MNDPFRRNLYFVFLIGLIFLLVSCGKKEESWGGSVETAGDVIVIRNPRIPLYGENAVVLKEELSLGGAEGTEEFQFSSMQQIDVDDSGRMYILDYKECHIKVFDQDGHYLFTFGKPGQGPGELDRPFRLFVGNEQVMVPDIGRRISFFSLEGEFVRSVLMKEVWGLRLQFDSQGDIYVTEGLLDPSDPRYLLKKFNADMEFVREIASSPAPTPNKSFNPFMPIGYWQLRYDDCLVYGYPETYELQVFNPEGEVIRRIIKDYDPVEATEEEKEEQLEDLPEQIAAKVSFSKYHSAFYRFALDEKGRIYVRTWEKALDGVGFIYDVFDEEGKFLARFSLEGTLHAVKNDKLYTIAEDEEGYEVAKRYEILWNYCQE